MSVLKGIESLVVLSRLLADGFSHRLSHCLIVIGDVFFGEQIRVGPPWRVGEISRRHR